MNPLTFAPSGGAPCRRRPCREGTTDEAGAVVRLNLVLSAQGQPTRPVLPGDLSESVFEPPRRKSHGLGSNYRA